MTPHQKMLVRATFAQILPIAETAGAILYARLFELDPSLQQLFTTDIAEQSRKLMQMIAVAVQALDSLETLLPAVRALGQRHAGYGVQDDHYETVAVALLGTLERALGAAFTPEVRQAWATVYWLLADTMREGAGSRAAPPSTALLTGER
jgi:hemoglobin-like flavoprotein